MAAAGYSGTPLIKKLGIKDNYIIRIYNPPPNYYDLVGSLPEGIVQVENKKVKKDFIHYFTKQLGEYRSDIVALRKEIKPGGMIWISWPKKAAKVPTDITEDFIRDIAIQNGLVDVKVCAVDEIWSGLKLVIPVKDRVSAVSITSKN